MSSLTSLGVNKSNTRFAPKVKARGGRRAAGGEQDKAHKEEHVSKEKEEHVMSEKSEQASQAPPVPQHAPHHAPHAPQHRLQPSTAPSVSSSSSAPTVLTIPAPVRASESNRGLPHVTPSPADLVVSIEPPKVPAVAAAAPVMRKPAAATGVSIVPGVSSSSSSSSAQIVKEEVIATPSGRRLSIPSLKSAPTASPKVASSKIQQLKQLVQDTATIPMPTPPPPRSRTKVTPVPSPSLAEKGRTVPAFVTATPARAKARAIPATTSTPAEKIDKGKGRAEQVASRISNRKRRTTKANTLSDTALAKATSRPARKKQQAEKVDKNHKVDENDEHDEHDEIDESDVEDEVEKRAAPKNKLPVKRARATRPKKANVKTVSAAAAAEEADTAPNAPAKPRAKAKIVYYEDFDGFDDEDDEDMIDELDDSDDEDFAPGRRPVRGDDNDEEIHVFEPNGESSINARMRNQRRRRAKRMHIMAKDMKTLDDINADPMAPGNLERPISYFLMDNPDGIVTKTFRDKSLARDEQRLAKGTAAHKETQIKLEKLEKERREREQQQALKNEQDNRQHQDSAMGASGSSGLVESSHALQVRLVNGQIMLDTDSMTIDRERENAQMSHEDMEVVEENAMSRRINSNSYGKRSKSGPWTKLETEDFYELLSMFGTDFEMMSKVMPGRTRSHLRLKFNREERNNPKRITEYLIYKKKPVDLAKYKQMLGIEEERLPDDFHTPTPPIKEQPL
ncbi:hypothetical protein BC940DRAFT_317394 [Gongronella butleri]|nr:hypothetical protein BC940DRAFT_317394 [Gongronella butleri]